MENEKEVKNPPVPEKEERVTTKHSLKLGNTKLNYTATTGTLFLREHKDESKIKARIFFTYYEKDGVRDKKSRPVIFIYNGGPGSSSIWLHMGAFGPRRCRMNADGSAPKPPFEIVDNKETLLDIADLVFVDPVSTGFSRAADLDHEDEFHGLEKDIEAMGDFIMRFSSQQGRWMSPKYLLGESYGTTRSAGLAGYLNNEQGMYLNGIILVSSILDFGTARFDFGNDLPYILFLPTYAAIAHYHGKAGKGTKQSDFLSEVESFAVNEYLRALFLGTALPEEDKLEVAKKLSSYTGLSEQFVLDCNLKPSIWRFTKNLLKEEGYSVGRFDGRIKGRDGERAGDHPETDPSHSATAGVFTTCFNDYVRSELNYDSEKLYLVLTGRAHPWKFDHEGKYVNVSDRLRQAICRNTDLKVMIANGYFDLATPYFATWHTVNHMPLTPELQKNISQTYYKGGHMMYTIDSERAKLKADIVSFIKKSSNKK
ncbi:peptidase S10 [bacterium]|nr:peptidase S10 [bacterium]